MHFDYILTYGTNVYTVPMTVHIGTVGTNVTKNNIVQELPRIVDFSLKTMFIKNFCCHRGSQLTCILLSCSML